MRSLRCEGAGRVAIVEMPDPAPGPDDVLVRIEASAVCGSERSAFMNGAAANAGHEACGRIVDAGTSGLAVGMRVGLSAVIGCGACDRCLEGRETQCRQGPRYTAGSGWHADMAAVPADAIRELPEGTSPTLGALLSGDTLGVPGRSLRRVPSSPGASVLLIGLGPIGLGHLVVRNFTGAKVFAIEPSPYRRELASKLGAIEVLPPGERVDVRPQLVIECTGRPECVSQALEAVDSGGTVFQSGECGTDVAINPSGMFVHREITYTGGWYYASEDYASMTDLVNEGLPLADICTHDVPAQKAQSAITEFLEGRSGKVIIDWESGE